MSASSAPAAKAALLGLLTTAYAADTDVQVSYAHPGVGLQQDSVFFRGTKEKEVAAVLGHLRRDEDYTLELIVSVALDGDDAQACEERMWALVATAENTLRANPTLSGAVNCWALFGGVDQTPYMEAGQRVSEAVCRIDCKHRK